jgi:sodium/hydrogen exchanger 8
MKLLLLSLLLALHSLAEKPECDQSSEQCQSIEEDVGHALLATRVTRAKIDGDGLPHAEVGEFEIAKQRVEAVQQMRSTVASQGSLSAEQLEQLLQFAEAAPMKLADNEKGESLRASILIDASATQPTQGKVADGNEDLFLPGNGTHNSGYHNLTHEGNAHDEEPVEKKVMLAKFVVAPISFVFLAVFTLSNVMEKYEITAVPESGIMIGVGVLLGSALKMYSDLDMFNDSDAFGQMNGALLNLVFLPIIIFASGWTVRRLDFYSQFPYILMFAMGGVALSTAVIACLIYYSGSMGWHGVTTWRAAFAYSSLISATDPVATLSTYAKLKVDPLLNIIVFGESIINDAVAITLFNVFNSDDYMVDPNGESVTGLKLIYHITYGVVKTFGGSAALGTGLGMGYTFIAHWADMKNNKKGQILVIFASCYLTYALAETLAMSGIIAEMFCALLLGVYMRPHLSTEGSLLATFFVKQLSMLADAAICLLIGVSVVQLTTKGWYFGLWTMLFCLIGRAFSVFPIAYLVNFVKETVGKANEVPEEGWNKLTPKHMFMMWHAGLRGAIALALSLELGKWVDVMDGEGTRRALQTATFFLICVFLLIFGGSTSTCLQKLGISTGEDHPADVLSKTEDMGRLRGFLKWVDIEVLTPLLVGRQSNANVGGDDEKDVEDLLKHVQKW